MPAGATLEALSATNDATVELVKHSNSDYPAGMSLGHTLIILDTSQGARALARSRHFNKEKEAIKTFIGGFPDRAHIALATFHEQGSLKIVQDFTTAPRRVETALDDVKLEGTSTHISEAVRDGVKILAAQDTSFVKNLVIFSDGQDEGVDIVNDVKAFADENNVVVSAIALTLTPTGLPKTGRDRSYLNEFVQDGFGVFAAVQASGRALDAEELADVGTAGSVIARSMLRSGVLMSEDNFESTEITLEVNVPLAGYEEGVTKSVSYSATAVNGGYEAPAVVVDTIEPTAPAPALSSFEQLFEEYGTLIIGAAVGLLLLIVILVLALSGGKKKKSKEPEADGGDISAQTSIEFADPIGGTAPTATSAQPALGYIHVKGTQQKLSITSASVTIGRAAPSDLCIDHPSVSRQHISLRLSSNGAFVSDLNSTNGTKVDGKKLSREVEIQSGTVISLGKCDVIFSRA
jgi:pSer/pThr/pTyr-binding forkhead associated (FHA) protein